MTHFNITKPVYCKYTTVDKLGENTYIGKIEDVTFISDEDFTLQVRPNFPHDSPTVTVTVSPKTHKNIIIGKLHNLLKSSNDVE